LQGILIEISRTRESLASTEAEITGSDALRHDNVFKKCAGHNLHAAYGEVKELKQSRQALEEQIGKLVLLRDRQIAVYQGARRNREMITDIQNDQRSTYESDAARREQKTLDDNYIARRGRF
jgi:hypothetical protein